MISEEKMQKYLLKDNRFFQTGSRYWNSLNSELVPITEKTDWDFVSEYDQQIVKELIKIGFYLKTNNIERTEQHYADGCTMLVLYYGETGSTQIIFKKNVSIYKNTRNYWYRFLCELSLEEKCSN
jgi:hypothetical protein